MLLIRTARLAMLAFENLRSRPILMARANPDITAESLVGLWRRNRIEFSDGRVDATTQAFWGQTRSLYIDVRIPASAAALLPRTLLGEYSAGELLALAEQKGFAGRIRLAGNRCEWIREFDYQPATGRPDIADIALDGDVLYETGDSGSALGSSYREIFQRMSPGSRVCVAAQLIHSDSPKIKSLSNQGCLLVLLDDWFLFAEPRARPLPAAPNLAHLVAGAPQQLAYSYLDCEYSFGRIPDNASPWKIQLSTLPSRTGQRLLPAASAAARKDHELRVDFPDGALRWHIIESNLPAVALADLFLL
ncbi:MAG TPA: hypothetical protein VGJ31_14600 [Dongiaceae bacterium]|jgi:hypothetical protein